MSRRCVIWNLHGVGEPQRDLEANEAPYWLSNSRFREIVQLAASLRDRVECHFTIDDGNMSDATIAGPYLAEMGFPTQIFVLTGRIGKRGSLDRCGLDDLIAMGHTIGSHGHAHRDWRRISHAQVAEEIHAPRQVLQDMTGRPVEAAGLPFGGYNRKVLSELDRAGFLRVYSSDGGPVHEAARPIGRYTLRADVPLDYVHAVLTNTEPLLVRLKRRIKSEIKKRI